MTDLQIAAEFLLIYLYAGFIVYALTVRGFPREDVLAESLFPALVMLYWPVRLTFAGAEWTLEWKEKRARKREQKRRDDEYVAFIREHEQKMAALGEKIDALPKWEK